MDQPSGTRRTPSTRRPSRRLHQAFETLQGAEGVRIVFLRGVGGAFSAGADLEWMKAAADWSEDDNRDDALGLAQMLKALHDIPALTVALVEGPAFGGGAGLVAACDHALATADAKFAFSEVKLGLTPATISPYVIAALGPRTAKLLFATGRVFDADQAWSYGLVDEVFDDAAGLIAAQDALIEEVAVCAPARSATPRPWSTTSSAKRSTAACSTRRRNASRAAACRTKAKKACARSSNVVSPAGPSRVEQGIT